MKVTIDISNHPVLTDIKRKVTHQSISIDENKKEVRLLVIVSHYDQNDVHLDGTINDKRELMIANNNKRVDGLGQVIAQYQTDVDGNILTVEGVPVVNPDWEAGTPEWDFLESVATAGAMDIYAMIGQVITTRANAGRFEEIY